MPVSESFGIADELRSSTEGRAFWATRFSRWTYVPKQLQADTIKKIRERQRVPPFHQNPKNTLKASNIWVYSPFQTQTYFPSFV
jgi:hypothetical protein